MLEKMMCHPSRVSSIGPNRLLGLTLVEVMVVVTILGILLAVALPSFTGYIDRQRAEAALEAISSDLRWARSESIRTNLPVRVVFTTGGSWNYVVRLAPSGANTAIKTVSFVDFPSTSIGSASFGSVTQTDFDPARGTATSGTVTVSTDQYSGQVNLGILGNVKICGMGGYDAC